MPSITRKIPGLLLVLLAGCLLGTPCEAARFNTVVIDAGHGGHDHGGIRQNIIPEHNVALDVALRLRRILNDAGVRTVMTRSTNVFVTLERRVAIANAQSRAIFVSIHFNSALRVGARGIETFYGSKAAIPLASRIQRNLMRTTSGDNRGIKSARYFVLRKTRLVAVLVECGFLTNPTDARMASSASYRETLARQIASAILEYRRS